VRVLVKMYSVCVCVCVLYEYAMYVCLLFIFPFLFYHLLHLFYGTYPCVFPYSVSNVEASHPSVSSVRAFSE
jgi:hypothetical protein